MRILRLYVTLFRAMGHALAEPKVRALLVFVVMIASLQAAVFMILENWGFVDAFYFAIVSMATVGYGDLTPQTVLGKLAAIVFLFIGIGIFVLAFSAFAQAFLQRLIADRPDQAGADHEDGQSGAGHAAISTHISVTEREA